jgi:hypothetical protein
MNASACAGVSIRRDIVLYVEQLIAPDVVDAMPEVTVRTFAITAELEREGVRSPSIRAAREPVRASPAGR